MRKFSNPTDVAAGLLFLALAALGLLASADLPMGSATRMGAGYVPRLLSLLLAGFGLCVLVNAIRTGDGEARGLGRVPLRPLLCVVLVPLLFSLLIDRLGLVATVVLATIAASVASPESRRWESAALAGGLAVFCLALFVWGLAIPVSPWPRW
ncbi:tripartite tricarboxylate transporter TctB family protein [Inquilinus sp.]|jgi:putative tricarboxylic transport membrane protein|uniref:tripartite tricarboxylate transporter TctB family protein n=1 Tax=Inquilinus sp. TaxID=1932117 RepID=UPI0037841E7F